MLADSQTLTDLTPLPVACSETLLAGYLARFMHDYLRQDPHLAPLHPPYPGHSGSSAQRRCPARHLRRTPATGPWPGGQAAAGGALLSSGGRSARGENADQGLRQILTMDLDNPSNRYLREPLAALGLTPAMELDSYLALIELAKAGIGPVLLPPAGTGRCTGTQARPSPASPARCTWSIGQTASSVRASPSWCWPCKPTSSRWLAEHHNTRGPIADRAPCVDSRDCRCQRKALPQPGKQLGYWLHTSLADISKETVTSSGLISLTPCLSTILEPKRAPMNWPSAMQKPTLHTTLPPARKTAARRCWR